MEACQFAELNTCSTGKFIWQLTINSNYCTVLLVLSLISWMQLCLYHRMFLFVVICQNGYNMQTWPMLQFSANISIACHEPTSRAPCWTNLLRIVPIMDCVDRSCELPLERFACTTAIAEVHSGFGLLVCVVLCCPGLSCAVTLLWINWLIDWLIYWEKHTAGLRNYKL